MWYFLVLWSFCWKTVHYVCLSLFVITVVHTLPLVEMENECKSYYWKELYVYSSIYGNDRIQSNLLWAGAKPPTHANYYHSSNEQ